MSASTAMATTRSGAPKEAVQWWTMEREDAHTGLAAAVGVIRDRASSVDRHKQNLLYASLYGSSPILGFGLSNYARYASVTRIALNVTQNAIDALVAKVTKNRPRPTFTTVEGDYEAREKAEDMSSFVNGQFYELGYYELAPAAALDACVYGTGGLKVYEKDGEPAIDRVMPWELLVDDRESLYGKPRTIIQRKYYDKGVVIAQFVDSRGDLTEEEKAELRKVIETGGGGEPDADDFDYDESSDQIRVYESWHLRSGKKASDGKHIIAIHEACFVLEDYEEDDFPIEFLRPMRQPMGFWGIGICEKLAGLQGEINRIVRDLQASMHLVAKPHWMVENGSKVTTAHLNNDIATIIKYSGAQPVVYVPQAMSPDVFKLLQWYYQVAYEITGISQLSAQSQKPAGLNSGVAIRSFLDVETERFTDFVRCYENMAKGVSEKLVAITRRIAGRKSDYSAKAITKGGLRLIKFSDADLKDQAVIQIFPTSMLPDTPAGKLAFVQEMMGAGGAPPLMDPDEALDLIDWPDTAAYAKRRGAARKVVERNISAMKHGIPVTPEPMDNHGLALKIVNEAYHEARLEGLDEERLNLLRLYLTATKDFIKKEKEEAAPPMPALMPPGPPANDVGAPPMPMAAGAPPPGLPPPMPPPGVMQ